MKLKKEVKTIVIIALVAVAVCGCVKLYIDRMTAINNGTMTLQDQHEK